MRPTGAQWAAVAGVAALAIVVGALSVAALQQARPELPAGTAAPAPTFDFRADPATASPTPSEAPALTVAADAERFLAVQGDRLWRSIAGACGGPVPVVELSTDRGRTWTDVTPPNAKQLFTTAALGDIAGEAVAATDDSCEPTVLRTYTNWRSMPWPAPSSPPTAPMTARRRHHAL